VRPQVVGVAVDKGESAGTRDERESSTRATMRRALLMAVEAHQGAIRVHERVAEFFTSEGEHAKAREEREAADRERERLAAAKRRLEAFDAIAGAPD
jgi:hypothetical protein